MMAIGNKLVQFNSPQFDYLSVVPKNLDCKTVHIFAYSSKREQSNKRSGTRLKTERAFETCLLRARKTLTARSTYFFTDFEEKKTTVLQSTKNSTPGKFACITGGPSLLQECGRDSCLRAVLQTVNYYGLVWDVNGFS